MIAKPLRGNPSILVKSKAPGIIGLVLGFIVAFISFNTWITLRHVLRHQDASQVWQAASHAPPPIVAMSSPYGLFVPEGPAIALPSVLATSDEEASIDRKFYGGKGDKAHLGGFTSFDPMGVSPTLWTHMVNHFIWESNP